jgi:hypothetical protein
MQYEAIGAAGRNRAPQSTGGHISAQQSMQSAAWRRVAQHDTIPAILATTGNADMQEEAYNLTT